MTVIKQKTISILLAIMMLVAFAPPAFAFAEDTPAGDQKVTEETAADGQAALKGTEDGEPSYNISDYTFKLSQNKFFYNGQPQKPAVICDGLPTDAYRVEYQIDWYDSYDEGTYEVHIYGNEEKGYSGSVTLSYQIVQTSIELSDYDVTIYRKGTYQLEAWVYHKTAEKTPAS